MFSQSDQTVDTQNTIPKLTIIPSPLSCHHDGSGPEGIPQKSHQFLNF